MSDCVLEDLVPRAIINEVTLESLNSANDVYGLTCDLSIRDTISTRGGIAKYFFSSNFKSYFKICLMISRDDIIPRVIEKLKAISLEDYELAYVLQKMFFSNGSPRNNIDTSIVSHIVKNDLIQILNQSSSESFELRTFQFSPDSSEDYGFNTFDDDGNFSYELRIPIDERLQFMNKPSIENCNLYAIPVYDFRAAFNERGVPFTFNNEMLRFGYKSFETINILTDKKITDTRVQDFRLVRRLEEYVIEDKMLGYEKDFEMIAKLSDRPLSFNYSDIVSSLFISYSMNGDSMFTKNIFYVDILKLLLRNTKYPFLYTNIVIATMFSGLELDLDIKQQTEIQNLVIKKDRVDLKRNPVFLRDIQQRDATVTNLLNFTFIDDKDEEVGEYQYTLQMSVTDPIENILETLSRHVIEVLLKKLNECLEYINNTNGYDPIIRKMNQNSEEFVRQTLTTSEVDKAFTSFKKLFSIFTAKNFDFVCQSLSDMSVIKKKKENVEQLTKAVEDFLFQISKYFPVLDSTPNSSTTMKPSSYLTLEYTFKELVDYSKQKGGMYNVIEGFIQGYDFPRSRYINRMLIEDQKYKTQVTSNYENLGYMTPNSFNGFQLQDLETSSELFFEVFSTILDGTESPNIAIDMALADPDNNPISSEKLQKDHATFESFATDLGLSVKKLDSSTEGETSTTRALESGQNDPTKNIREFLDNGVSSEPKRGTNFKTSLLESRSKKEELINRFLVSNKGYSVLDRKDFTQGTKQAKRFNPNNYPLIANFYNRPKFLGMYPRFFSKSADANIFTALFHRLILNNLYVVYYLSSFDQNLNPIWTPLTELSELPEGTLCKLDRFRADSLGIKDSLLVDREIMSKYFYL